MSASGAWSAGSSLEPTMLVCARLGPCDSDFVGAFVCPLCSMDQRNNAPELLNFGTTGRESDNWTAFLLQWENVALLSEPIKLVRTPPTMYYFSSPVV